ncbi:MAG: hypothetical protein HZB38_11160, partial [Planctomycetes bacterium]|nr:hypothetical protein [Planctomycetota bacterium]
MFLRSSRCCGNLLLLAIAVASIDPKIGLAVQASQTQPACSGPHATVPLAETPCAPFAAPASKPAPPDADTDAKIERARTLLEDRRIEEADRLLRDLLAGSGPTPFEALFLAAQIRFRLGA